MPLIPVPQAGAIGCNKDLSVHELPLGAWTDALNMRFMAGYCYQYTGQGEVYKTPSASPQYILPVAVGGLPYWLYATAAQVFVVTSAAGVVTHTDITPVAARTGIVNAWSGTVFGGVPILNSGDTVRGPMYWDQVLADKCAELTAWPANTYCKVMRSFGHYLIALGITKTTTSYPYMVKWSSPADAGSLPSTWDPADATNDAGEYDLSDGQDIIIDGLQLRDSFMIYKEKSIWRMDLIGGVFVFSFRKVLGTSGALNRNCIVELDGFHCVLTGYDVIVHDGQTATSVFDKIARRYLFDNIDVDNQGKCFVFKNPFLNEVYICYPQIGSSVCDRAAVWNYEDKTVSFRELPNVNHANVGTVEAGINGSWDQLFNTWDQQLKKWDGPSPVPNTERVIMASANQKLYMMDSTASFDGTNVSAYMERVGMSFDAPDQIKLVRGIRSRISGNAGETVIISVGGMDDPYADPIYTATMTHTIGQTVADDCLVSGRYICIKYSSGTAAQWRLDSFTLDIETGGMW